MMPPAKTGRGSSIIRLSSSFLIILHPQNFLHCTNMAGIPPLNDEWMVLMCLNYYYVIVIVIVKQIQGFSSNLKVSSDFCVLTLSNFTPDGQDFVVDTVVFFDDIWLVQSLQLTKKEKGRRTIRA
jgi:hypothetical protein|mmetsp:Transcript_393/g.674  ORF Transcript_393/g.674 Transcript_393/m.674 type:complete len:125 (-) Transcript_393:995-1369(-)